MTPRELLIHIMRHGGITLDMRTARHMRHGYAVGRELREYRMPVTFSTRALEERLQAYAFHTVKPGDALGIWLDTDAGEFVLDSVQILPDRTYIREVAELAKQHGQLAFYNLTDKRLYYTKDF